MKHLGKIVFAFFLCIVLTGCGQNLYEEGMEQLQNGQYEEAAESLEQAVEKGKNTADSYRGLGIAYWELGEYEQARDALLNAVDHGADATVTFYNLLGNCELELGNAESALEYYEKALSTNEADASLVQDIEFNIIVAYEQLMDMDTAREKLIEYLQKYPDDEAAAKEAEFLETR